MSRHLVIPDVHQQHVIVDRILENQSGKFDKVIFLGDYFDNWGDRPINSKETAKWLNKNLDHPDYTFLRGNHDVQYMYSINRELHCVPFDHDRVRAIFSELDLFKFREKTSLFKRVGNFIFSHAGVSKELLEILVKYGEIEKFEYSAESVERVLTSLIPKSEESLGIWQMPHQLYWCARDRGGLAPVGGLTWVDIDSYDPIPNVVNVFGHSTVNPDTFALTLTNGKPSFKRSHKYFPEKDTRIYEKMYKNGIGIGIDTHLHTFAILDDVTETIEIYKIFFDKKIRDHYYDRNIVQIEKVWEYKYERYNA